MNMTEFKISEIISNEGFQKVAYAIRKSTVTYSTLPRINVSLKSVMV